MIPTIPRVINYTITPRPHRPPSVGALWAARGFLATAFLLHYVSPARNTTEEDIQHFEAAMEMRQSFRLCDGLKRYDEEGGEPLNVVREVNAYGDPISREEALQSVSVAYRWRVVCRNHPT